MHAKGPRNHFAGWSLTNLASCSSDLTAAATPPICRFFRWIGHIVGQGIEKVLISSLIVDLLRRSFPRY